MVDCDVDRDQWSKINDLRADLHRHERDCSEWRGKTDARLGSIESDLRELKDAILCFKNRIWWLFGVLVSGLFALGAAVLAVSA